MMRRRSRMMWMGFTADGVPMVGWLVMVMVMVVVFGVKYVR